MKFNLSFHRQKALSNPEICNIHINSVNYSRGNVGKCQKTSLLNELCILIRNGIKISRHLLGTSLNRCVCVRGFSRDDLAEMGENIEDKA